MLAIVDRLTHCLCALLKIKTTCRIASKQRASVLLMYPSFELFECTGFIRVSYIIEHSGFFLPLFMLLEL